jgi:hypothetical protein
MFIASKVWCRVGLDPREQTEQKKNQLNMSSVIIESAYKNYNF